MKAHSNYKINMKIMNKHTQVYLKTSPKWLEISGNNHPSYMIIKKTLHVDFDVMCYEIDTKMHSNH